MKLRNKKTGEIKEIFMPEATSLQEFCELYEDYEEPKEYWYVSAYGNLAKTDIMTDLHRGAEEIGNLFQTKKEAEKAVEKLKAWKRLKDNGFRFLDYTALGFGEIKFEHNVMDEIEDIEQLEKDMNLLFGGEE